MGVLWRNKSVCWTLLIEQGLLCLLRNAFVHQYFELRLVSQLEGLLLHTESSCVGFQ